MSFYVRVFSQVEDFPSLHALCDELAEADFHFATSPGKGEPEFDEENWKNIMLQYSDNEECIDLERNVKGGDQLFTDEQQEFLESLKDVPYGKGQKQGIEIVKNAMQIYAFRISPDITEEGWDFLECILDFLCDATDGYVQIDDEGIYDKDGELMVEME